MTDKADLRHTPDASPIGAPSVYPFPKSREGLLPWSRAVEQFERARNYWLATIRPDGHPHVAPLWDARTDEAFYFQGAPGAQWTRNLAANSVASVHLESGDNVVIVDGVAEHLITDAALADRLIEAWHGRYGRMDPKPTVEGLYRLQPHAARAWSEGLREAARWTFPAS